MSKFNCIRCGYKTDLLCNYKKHLKRQKICDSIIEDVTLDEEINKYFQEKDDMFKCECGKTYSSRQGYYTHKKVCSHKQNEILKCEMNELKSQLNELKRKVENVGCNTNNVNNGTINNIIINVKSNEKKELKNFGYENMEAIPDEFIRSCLMNLEFRTLFENLHCDPEYPENHNVRLKSMKNRQIEMYKDDSWKTLPFQEGLYDIIKQLHNIFDIYYNNNRDKVIEDVGDEIDDLIKTLDEISIFTKKSDEIKRDILCALDDHRKQVMKI